MENGVQTSYLYDNRNRLTRESFTKNGQTTVTAYQYDPNGNLYSKQTLTYGDNTIQTPEVSAVLMGYTADTNDMLLEYNNFNQLTTVTKGDSIFSYDYYANGLRKTKYEQSDHNYTTAYYWDGQNMVGEMFMDSLSTYLRGHRLIAVPAGENTQYYHFNGHGDVTTTTDMYGVMCDYQYDAFGNVENPYDWDYQPFRYCGEYYDVETGFIYLRNRYYDPSMGRFISEDPIRDGVNWYAYCGNNPVMFVDPTGLKDVGLRAMVESLGGTVTPNEKKIFGVSFGLESITVNLNGITKTYTSSDYHISLKDEEIEKFGKDRAIIDDEKILNDFYGDIGDGTGNPTKQQAINYITRVSYRQGVPIRLSLSVAWTESNMNQILKTTNRVDNGGGDYGIMQINICNFDNCSTPYANGKNIVNNWHNNVDFGIWYLNERYIEAKSYGYTGNDLLKATYSNYNSYSCSKYKKDKDVAEHVDNFWRVYQNEEWE